MAPADLRSAFWVILEREEGWTDAHGPIRIAFLHVQCEAVWLFWKLWSCTGTPGPFAILLQDHGYGGNWTSFGAKGELFRCAAANEALPEWLLVADNTTTWPDYYPQSDATPTATRRLPPDLGDDDSKIGGRVLYIHERGLLSKLVSKETALLSPESAFIYARDFLKSRWPEAEEVIEKSFCKNAYLVAFPEASGRFLIISILRGAALD